MVSGIVLAQRSDEDHPNQADQEDDHHERVKNGEPMDAMLEERGVEVLVESVLEQNGRWLPDHLKTRTYSFQSNFQFSNLIAEFEDFARLDVDPAIRGQIHVDNLLLVVADLQLLVRVEPVHCRRLGIVRFTDHS